MHIDIQNTSIIFLSTHYQGGLVSKDPYTAYQWRSLQIVGAPFLNNVNINVHCTSAMWQLENSGHDGPGEDD